MKGLRCSEIIAVINCDYIAMDEKSENVKKKIYEHLKEKHKDIMKNMSKADYERTNIIIDKTLKNKFFEYRC